MKRRVEVELTEEEAAFIGWLAERDGVTFQRELQQIFYTELGALIDLHATERETETAQS